MTLSYFYSSTWDVKNIVIAYVLNIQVSLTLSGNFVMCLYVYSPLYRYCLWRAISLTLRWENYRMKWCRMDHQKPPALNQTTLYGVDCIRSAEVIKFLAHIMSWTTKTYHVLAYISYMLWEVHFQSGGGIAWAAIAANKIKIS